MKRTPQWKPENPVSPPSFMASILLPVLKRGKAQSQLSLFCSLQQFHDAPSLQDCCQCSCLCFSWWWPCPSCPWRTAAWWVSPEACKTRLSISHASAHWTNPSLGLRTWLASRVLNITTQVSVVVICFSDLCFLFQQTKRLKTSMAVRRTDHKW